MPSKIHAVVYGQHPLTGDADPYVVDASPDMTVGQLVERLRKAAYVDPRSRVTATLIEEGRG